MSSFGPCLKSRFDSFQSPSQYYGSPITITTTSPWPTSTTPSSSTPAAAAAGSGRQQLANLREWYLRKSRRLTLRTSRDFLCN